MKMYRIKTAHILMCSSLCKVNFCLKELGTFIPYNHLSSQGSQLLVINIELKTL